MSDDLLQDLARTALAPIVEATPTQPDWDELAAGVGPPRARRSWNPLIAATAAALGVTTVVLVAVLIARGSPVPDVAAPTAPSATSTSVASSTSEPRAETPPVEGTTSVVVAQLGPDPGVDTAEPLTFLAIDSPSVRLVTASDLTRVAVITLDSAAQQLLGSTDATPPYTVEAAFTRKGNTYAVVTYGDSSRGLVVIGDDPYKAWNEEPWVEVRFTRRGDAEPWVELMWLGIPDGASHVTVTSPEYPDNAPQRVIASSAFAAMPKPFWTQYVTLSAISPDGETLASREFVVDGSTCSAGKQNPRPVTSDDLPEAVDAARTAMFAEVVGCRYGVLETRATGSDDLFFGAGSDSLAATLRELDRRTDLMMSMRSALLLVGRAESRGGETVFVFESASVEIVLDSDGRWVSAKLTE